MAGLHGAHTAVAAEAARNYLLLRGLQQRQNVTEASLVNQRDALHITDARMVRIPAIVTADSDRS